MSKLAALTRAIASQGASGPATTVYVEQDFTTTTSGDLSVTGPDIDELGLGWLDTGAYSNADQWKFDTGGGGVYTSDTAGAALVVIQTDGREDVQITSEMNLWYSGVSNRWTWPVALRMASVGSPLYVAFYGTDTADPDLQLLDAGSLLKTWDLSALLTNQPEEGDLVRTVFRCEGDDITFYSMQVNGGAVEVADDTYTLTGSAATNHGAGSGADHYGFGSNSRGAAADGHVKYFKVESIPA